MARSATAGGRGGPPGPPPSYGAAKKRSAEPVDQLPYQRKATFRRRVHQGPEDLAHELLGRHPGEPYIRVVLGRVLGTDGQRDVVLPFAHEVILSGSGHAFVPDLTPGAHEGLCSCLEAQVRASRSGTSRWAEVSREEAIAEVPPEPLECLTFFCPGGAWHYQLQVGGRPQPGADGGVLRQRQEVVYRFRKDASPSGFWWALAICSEGLQSKVSAELRLNVRLLWEQHNRLSAGKSHSFSLLVRDLLRNARCLVAALREGTADADLPCFYPGLFEPAVAVQQHYAEKAVQSSSNLPSASDNVRKYNNLVKTLLIEHFVDSLKGPVRILDLGCGRGQDLQKYSRAFRKAQIASYVGMDFALEAVQEARRRYAKMVSLRKGEPQYLAAFYVGSRSAQPAASLIKPCGWRRRQRSAPTRTLLPQCRSTEGDLRNLATFDQLLAGGHSQFDVVSLQFTLQYLAESAEAVRTLFARFASLLRHGGRIIGCIPSSDVLLDLYTQPGQTVGTGAGAVRKRGNGLYSVLFRGDAWARIGKGEGELEEAFSRRWGLPYAFSLVDAVDAVEEYVVPWDALEELAESVGFKVVADAPFPDVLREYSKTSPFYADFFSKDPRVAELTAEEESLFGFYSCFVLERV